MLPDLSAHWLGKLANLNAAKTAGLGVAPHKPLMIFSVMDLIEMDILRDRWVPYNADLTKQSPSTPFHKNQITTPAHFSYAILR